MSNGKDAQAAKSAQAKPASLATNYIVLRAATESPLPTWVEVGQTKAVNAIQAIRNLVDDEADATIAYVATPARSWNPVKPTVKVEKRVVWS